MSRLRDEYDETTNLSVLDGTTSSTSISSAARGPCACSPHRQPRAGVRDGLRQGDARLLAGVAARGLYATEPYEQFAPNTVTSAERLREELERVRARGYAMDREEYDEGVVCVAAPIFNHAGVLGALSVSGPASRMYRLDLSLAGEQIAGAGLEISRELGYVAT